MANIQILKGGQTNDSVVRISNTVHRSLNPNSEKVHMLLKHLEIKGYKYSPRFLGIDNEGNEILSYIEGEVPSGNIDWTTDRLVKVATMLKQFHEMSSDCVMVGLTETIVHSDIAPWNTVVIDGVPIAFIDFDGVKPGKGIEDLAYMIWTFLDLGDENIALEKQLESIRTICDTYSFSNGQELVENIIQQQHRILKLREDFVQNSEKIDLRDFSKEQVNVIKKQIQWVQKHKAIIENSL